MDANYENTVLDFDLNFFQCNSIPNKNDKQKIAIKTAKKKIIATNILIRRFYDKKQTLEHAERNLITAKEECKQVCIDYKSALEKCSELEKTTQFLKEVASECEKRCVMAETQNSALQSHAHQLQQVVKENETLIEALKMENRLEKDNSRNYESRITALESKNESLTKYLQMAHSVIIGKKKLSTSFKQLLQKFNDNTAADVDGDDISSDLDQSDNESFIDDSPLSPFNTNEELINIISKDNENAENNISKRQLQVIDKALDSKTDLGKDETDRDSDSNEIVSIDTGCASSLSFSDSFLSPEHYIEDGSNPDEIKDNTIKTKHTNTIRTSPITIKARHIATSPVKFELNEMRANSLKNTATSPLIFQCSITDLEENTLSQNTSFDEHITKKINNPKGEKEKECLTLNKSDNFSYEENSNDLEIETILNTMRFNRNLITPLPSSPCKSRNTEIASCTESISIHRESVHAHSHVCLEASKIREENKILHSSIADLAKEVLNIKSLLKNQLLSGNSVQTDQEKITTPFLARNDDLIHEHTDFDQKLRLTNKNKYDIYTTNLHKRKEINLSLNSKKEINSSIKRKSCDENDLNNRNCDLEMRTSDNETELLTSEFVVEPSEVNLSTKHLTPIPCKHINIESQDNTSIHEDKAKQSNKLNIIKTCHNLKEISNRYQENHASNEDSSSGNLDAICNNIDEISSKYQENHVINEDRTSDNFNAPTKNKKMHNIITTWDNFEEISPEENHPTNEDATSDSVKNFCNEPQDSREMLQFEDILHDENINDNINLVKTKDPSVTSSTTFDNCSKRLTTNRTKLTRLAKLRKNMIPRNKIKSAEVICKKPLKSKAWQTIKDKNKFNARNSSALLNNREAYEKALKVMSELKAKQKLIEGKKVIRKVIKRKKNNKTEEDTDNKKSNDPIPYTLVEASTNNHHNVTYNDTNVEQASNKSSVINQEVYENNQSIIPEKDSILQKESENKQINISKNKQVESSFDKKLSNETKKDNKVEEVFENKQSKLESLTNNVITRSRGKNDEIGNSLYNIQEDDKINKYLQPNRKALTAVATNNFDRGSRKRHINTFQDQPEIENKRLLRSSTINKIHNSENSDSIPVKEQFTHTKINKLREDKTDEVNDKLKDKKKSLKIKETIGERENVDYEDLDLFVTKYSENVSRCVIVKNARPNYLKDSILCTLLEKYAVNTINTKNIIPNPITNKIYETITNSMENISKLSPKEAKTAMDLLVDNIKANVNVKHFVNGLIKYLNDPERKTDLFSKSIVPGGPHLTKSEQILLYVLGQLKLFWPEVDIVDIVLNNIEYTLFRLNGTPDFNTIESMSHFYAVLCRYFKARSRLRLFMLDAMYCIQYKAIPLVKQCLEVWMHALPLAHMGIAKSPLVICLVYLLHFFKCEDKFNRVSEIRTILNRKYSYQLSDWNETRILECFKNAILELKSNTLEEKTLRLALIILAKRHGTKWCQTKIIKNLLLPTIDDYELPESIRSFCVSILGPLMKPFPNDMKVHCVIVMNKLIDTLAQKPSHTMQEAIISSLIYMSKHDNNRVLKALLFWSPEKISPRLEKLFKGYIMEKPAKKWKFLLSTIHL